MATCKGPWKDWVVVDWGRRDGGKSPAHISCFIKLHGVTDRNIKFDGLYLKDGVYPVVEGCQFEQDYEEAGEIFVPLLKDVDGFADDGSVESRKYELANVEAFVAPCCVVPDIGGPANRYFMVESRPKWSKMFVKWVEDPHTLDTFSDDEKVENP